MPTLSAFDNRTILMQLIAHPTGPVDRTVRRGAGGLKKPPSGGALTGVRAAVRLVPPLVVIGNEPAAPARLVRSDACHHGGTG